MARYLGRFDEVVSFTTLDGNIFAHHIRACLPTLDHDNGAWLFDSMNRGLRVCTQGLRTTYSIPPRLRTADARGVCWQCVMLVILVPVAFHSATGLPDHKSLRIAILATENNNDKVGKDLLRSATTSSSKLHHHSELHSPLQLYGAYDHSSEAQLLLIK